MEQADIYILKNKPLPEGAVPLVKEITDRGERVLFVIVGDLSLSGKYAETANRRRLSRQSYAPPCRS